MPGCTVTDWSGGVLAGYFQAFGDTRLVESQQMHAHVVDMIIVGVPPGIGINNQPLEGIDLLQLELTDIFNRHILECPAFSPV